MIHYPDTIIIEIRNPRNKDEAACFGATNATSGRAVIFVNARKNRSNQDLKDTLLHECYHAITGMYGFSNRHEEQIASYVAKSGNVRHRRKIEPIFKRTVKK